MNAPEKKPNLFTILILNLTTSLWAIKYYLLRDLYILPSDCIAIEKAGDMDKGTFQSYICKPLIGLSKNMTWFWNAVEQVKAPQEYDLPASMALASVGVVASDAIYAIADVVESVLGEGKTTGILTDFAYKTRYNTDYITYKAQLNHPNLLSLQNFINMAANVDIIRLYSIYDAYTTEGAVLFNLNLATNIVAKYYELKVEVSALENMQFLDDCRNKGTNCLELVVNDLTAKNLFLAYFPDTVGINWAFFLSKVVSNINSLSVHSASLTFDAVRTIFKYEINENLNAEKLEALKLIEKEALVRFMVQYSAVGYDGVCENDKQCNKKLELLANKIKQFSFETPYVVGLSQEVSADLNNKAGQAQSAEVLKHVENGQFKVSDLNFTEFCDFLVGDIALHNVGQACGIFDNCQNNPEF